MKFGSQEFEGGEDQKILKSRKKDEANDEGPDIYKESS